MDSLRLLKKLDLNDPNLQVWNNCFDNVNRLGAANFAISLENDPGILKEMMVNPNKIVLFKECFWLFPAEILNEF